MRRISNEDVLLSDTRSRHRPPDPESVAVVTVIDSPNQKRQQLRHVTGPFPTGLNGIMGRNELPVSHC